MSLRVGIIVKSGEIASLLRAFLFASLVGAYSSASQDRLLT